jgi:O-antigen ligase
MAAGVVLFLTWSPARKLRVLIVAPIYALLMHLIVPGLLGTFKKLFSGASKDDSITHRTGNYKRIGSVLKHHQLFGTGFGTYLPSRAEFILDNAYLGHLFETGIIGLSILLLFFVVAFFTARGARHRSINPVDRSLAQSLAASVVVVFPSFFTFDAFQYSMVTGTAFLVAGCCGAAWRLARDDQLLVQAA